MSDPEFSASEEGIFVAETSNQSSSPSKPSRGTSKRGRGKSKRSRKLSSDNDSSSNGLHVSSLKHVGKFRYLSNLTQAENAEADSAKPVASRGKRGNGRGRGRGRSSSNHMTSSVNTSELSNQVSRSGRRIKPNNRWAPDADFDPGPVTKVLPTRQRKSAVKSAKTIAQEKSPPEQHSTTENDADKDEEVATLKESIQQIDSSCEDRLADVDNESNKSSREDEVHSPSNNLVSETSETGQQKPNQNLEENVEITEEVDTKADLTEVVEVSSTSHDVSPAVIDDQDLTVGDNDVVIQPSEISVELVCSNEIDQKHIPIVEGVKIVMEDDSMQIEPASTVPSSSQIFLDVVENCNSEITSEAPRSECGKDLNHVDASDSASSEREDFSQGLTVKEKDSATDQLYNSSAGNTPRGDDEAFDTQLVLISPKPVKVKSRWRRTSELEQVVGRNGNSDQSSCNNSPLSMSPKTGCSLPVPSDNRENQLEEKSRMALSENVAIIQERLKSFEIVEENQYLTSRKTSKEVKRMLCDCSLTKEEIARGELGCGEDCINRLLMIECGPRCQLAARCTNKRFQKRQYGKIEVFNTEKKGVGLRALQDMDPGDFIIEYVGEVIDPREFHRRAKDYAREKNKHYYFMALKSDAIIDATQQGNVSRFINHSCDPNAETQKWTVNGDLRVGFFARKSLKSGDEVTFDYQFQRYGKEAQRCYCESSNCRGWIGEDPEKEDKNRDKKEKRDREKRKSRSIFRDEVNTIDLESEIERLVTLGVKNRTETLNLSRLMVRAEDFEARRNILTVLRNAEQACRRLFLDYHGLKLLWGWMVDASSFGQSSENVQFKIDLLSTLSSLPVPNKTMLLDSKLISIVEKWTTLVEPQLETVKTENSAEIEESSENQTELPNQVISMASQLLESWSNLKEVFRIPKKERIEKMKEHEREADLEWDMIPDVIEQTNKQSSYDRRPNNHHRMDSGYRDPKDRDKSKRMRESPDRENRKIPRLEDNISKEERRRLFALKVAQQDEEQRVRRCREEDVWRRHLEQCLSFGVEPTMTPLNCEPTPFINSASPGFSIGLPQVIWDPVLGVWQPCSDEHGSSSANLSALTPLSESSSTNQAKIPNEPPLLHLVIPKGYNPTVMGPLIMDFDLCKHEASGIPYVPASLVSPLENDTLIAGSSLGDLQDSSLLSSKLPRFWRNAVDERGRIYYYHVRLRLPQWEIPAPEIDTPDFSSEEEEDVEDAIEPITSTAITEPVDSPILENSKEQEKERRRKLLCHEKIISPRSEFERSDDAQRYRELKERVLRQKLARIRERGLWIEETKAEEKTKNRDKERRKLNEKEKEKMRKRAKEKYKRSLLKGDGRKKIKDPSTKDVLESAGLEDKDGEAAANGEGNDLSVERYMMDGSLDDYMLLGEGEDEAGEQERNRDVSANTVRKIKDAFRMKISSDIVNILNPYRRPDCKLGRITCTDDFKHLARKMTHFVLAKELKHCRNIQDLVVNDSVKHKAKDFIKKYMAKFGPAYKRGNDEDA